MVKTFDILILQILKFEISSDCKEIGIRKSELVTKIQFHVEIYKNSGTI